MTHEDYDTILAKGWKPFFMEYLPRVIDPQEFIDCVRLDDGQRRSAAGGSTSRRAM